MSARIFLFKKINFMLDIKIFKYIMTIYNKYKEVISMATGAELPITIIEKFYKDKAWINFISTFEEVCTKYKKVNSTSKILKNATLRDLLQFAFPRNDSSEKNRTR